MLRKTGIFVTLLFFIMVMVALSPPAVMNANAYPNPFDLVNYSASNFVPTSPATDNAEMVATATVQSLRATFRPSTYSMVLINGTCSPALVVIENSRTGQTVCGNLLAAQGRSPSYQLVSGNDYMMTMQSFAGDPMTAMSTGGRYTLAKPSTSMVANGGNWLQALTKAAAQKRPITLMANFVGNVTILYADGERRPPTIWTIWSSESWAFSDDQNHSWALVRIGRNPETKWQATKMPIPVTTFTSFTFLGAAKTCGNFC